MAKDPKPKEDDNVGDEESENVASELDELTHKELRLLHAEASQAILFAKNIQWRSVGSSLLVFAAMVFIAVETDADDSFIRLMSFVTIVLTCGVIFVLVMYQFWQFNEISRIREAEKHFSSLYRDIRDIKSSREGNVHRYTLLLFMILVVIIGAIVANVGLTQAG